jgi:site-specific recombinase XerD
MVIRVERGKGKKDRQVMLCESLLGELRACWKRYRPVQYLLEGKHPGQPIAATSIQRAFRAACRKTGITKPVTPRSLRHAFATHLVERGTNLRVVQTLLGHQSLNTTAVYTHLARTWLDEVKSPLDSLKSKDKTPKT